MATVGRVGRWGTIDGPPCRTLGRLPAWLRGEADVRLAAAVPELAQAEPGALLDVADLVVAELAAAAETRRESTAWLALQPTLDGSVGTLQGRFGPVGFAAISDAVDAAAPPRMLEANPRQDAAVAAGNASTLAQARAQWLLRLCSAAPVDGTADDAARDEAAGGSRAVGSDPAWVRRLGRRPLLLATVPLETLLGMCDRPGRLLTTRTGGHLTVTAPTARRIAGSPQGIDLRLVVHDRDGGTVGVGRRRRLAPGWLRDAVLAAQPRCVWPGCDRPARLAQLDHTRGFHPNRGENGGGATDADDLGPLCPGHHTVTTRSGRQGWAVHTDRDGTVTHHPVAGITVTQPSLWRPDRLASPDRTAVAASSAGRRRRAR